MKNLKEIIEAVQNNNEINNSVWADWENADHIIDIYCDSENKYVDFYCDIETAKKMLNKAIKNNGATIENDMFELKMKLGII